MNGINPVVLSCMLNPMHLAWVGIDPALAVAHNCAVLPAAFPELVDDLHVLLGRLVPVVVLGLPGQAHAACGTVEIAGDDVPTDPPACEMIERRHAAGEKIRRLVGEIARH